MKNILIIALCLLSFSAKAQDSLMTSKGEKRDTGSLFAPYKAAIQTNTTNIGTNTTAVGLAIKSDYFPLVSNSMAFGNSIGAGYLSNNKSFIDLAANYSGAQGVINYSVSSTAIRFAYSQLSKNKPGLISRPLLMGSPEFNNSRVLNFKDSIQQMIRAGFRAFAALHWLSSINFCVNGLTGATASNVTLSSGSGWAGAGTLAILADYGSRSQWYRNNDSLQYNTNMIIKTSLTANETMTMTGVIGSSVVIGTWGTDGTTNNWSRIQYAVDGTVYGTYTPNGKVTLSQPVDGGTTLGIMNDAIVVTGLSDSVLHTVVLTFLDGGTKSAIDYIGSLVTAKASYSIPIYKLDCFHMSNVGGAGYNYPGGQTTPSVMDSVSLITTQEFATTFPGYRVINIKTNQYYNPSNTAQVNGDGIHPTYLGQQKIMQAIKDSMTAYGSLPSNSANQPFTNNTYNRLVKYNTNGTVANSLLSDDGTNLTQPSGSYTNNQAISIVKNGSDGIGSGPFYSLGNLASTAAILLQFNATNGLDYWWLASGTWTQRFRFTSTGSLGIGTTSPTAVLHLKAGTSAAGTGPLKFTSGTPLTTPEAGIVEMDLNNELLYSSNNTSASRGYIQVNRVLSTATSLTTGGTLSTILITATGQTITLPSAVGLQGREFTIKLTAVGTGTVATTSTQNIDASTTYSLSAQYKYVTVQSDNANWFIVANN